MENTRKISTIINETLVENGNIKRQKRLTEYRIPIEPDYIKLYLADLEKIMHLQKGQRNLLDMLLVRMESETLYISIPNGLKKKIAEELNTSVKVVDNNLKFLVDRAIIEKIGTGFYRGNPNLFGKGKWTNIHEIRLQIKYNKEGRIVSVDFEEDSN